MDDSFDVVISGIGGRFPECDHIDTLMDKLHLGENLITLDERRWAPGKNRFVPGNTVKPGYNALEGNGPREEAGKRFTREMSFWHNLKGNYNNSDFYNDNPWTKR